jgi:hypothetical protein
MVEQRCTTEMAVRSRPVQQINGGVAQMARADRLGIYLKRSN